MERHFTKCADCREFLALFSRVSEELVDQSTAPPSEEEVKIQAARVLDEIRKDESKHRAARGPHHRPGIYVPYWQLAAAASLLIALTVSLYFYARDPSPDQFARQSLALALRDERFIEPRVSGGIAWSRYTPTRGDEKSDRLRIETAIKRMSFAESPSAPQEDRLTLARLYLASGRKQADRALEILSQIASTDKASAQSLNDLGAAMLVMERFDEAAAAFTRALEKSPRYEEALFNRALAHQRAGRAEEARRDWQEFISKSSDEGWKSEARQHLDSLSPAR
jgi:tetratricopeptide (TPR) repeat protein